MGLPLIGQYVLLSWRVGERGVVFTMIPDERKFGVMAKIGKVAESIGLL